MYDYSLSMPLTRALARNSDGFEFSTVYTQTAEPTGPDEGIHNMGQGGGVTTNQIVVYPYALSEPGSAFWMRIYGWRVFGNDPNTCIWIRSQLAQWSCVVGRMAGFTGRLLWDQERFCANGMDIAFFYVPVLGCQKIQFEFVKNDELPSIGMNALWGRTT